MWTPQIRCEEVRRRATRIEDVANPWLDAHRLLHTMGYTTDRAYWEKWVPGRPGA